MSDKVSEAPATAEPPKVEAAPKAEERAVTPVPAAAAEETKAEAEKPAAPKVEDAPKAAAAEESKAAAEKAAPAATPIQGLWATAKASGHPEIWGVSLADRISEVPQRQ